MVERCRMIGWVAGAIALALPLASCGTDLGTCDLNALGGSNVQGMLAPHDGQKIINNSCASGSCHSDQAEGTERNGAPAELDFDVVPATVSEEDRQRAIRGGGVVHNEMEEMWELIDSGAMPPEGKRSALTGDEKEKVRNWLACGAEVVAVPATSNGVTPDLTSIHGALTGMTCKTCHGAGSPDNPFLAGDACTMFNALVGKTALSPNGDCMSKGLTLVVAGNPDASVFLGKMLKPETKAVPCGLTMPLGAPTPLEGMDPLLVAAIRTWIMNGAQKPTGCL